MTHVLKFKKGAYILKEEPVLVTVLDIIPVEAFTVLNNFLQSIIFVAESTFKKNTHSNIAVFLSLSSFFFFFFGESSMSLKRGCS